MNIPEAADTNFALHATSGLGGLPGNTINFKNDLVVVDSGIACDTFNVVCRARLQSGEASNRIRATLDHFTAVARPFSWWVSPADLPDSLEQQLSEAGLMIAETSLAMSADLSTIPRIDLSPGGLEIRRAQGGATFRDLTRILAGWDRPDPDVLQFYSLAGPLLIAKDSPRWFYVGYLGEQPVAVAEATVYQGVAGLYGVMTREPFRGRGFATALSTAPLLEARAAGCRTGVLQASEAGARVYSRLGFQVFGEVQEFK